MFCWRRRATAKHTNDPHELEHAQRERDEAITRTVAAIQLTVRAWQAAELAHQQAEAARALMSSMLEPTRVDGCDKVRFQSHDEAADFAARVLAETGVRCVPHKCRICPRHPVSLDKFWHITTEDRNQRGKRRGPHHHPARLLRHIAPETAAMLRARVRREVS